MYQKKQPSINYFLVLISIFILNLSYGMVIAILPTYFEGKGLSVLSVSFLFSLYTFAKAISQFPSGFIVDKFDKIKLLTCVFALLSTIYVCYVIVSELALFYLLRVVEGALAGVAFPLIYSLLGTNINDAGKGLSMGLFTMIASLASAMGPLITGIIQNINIEKNIVFVNSAIGCILSALLLILFYKKSHENNLTSLRINPRSIKKHKKQKRTALPIPDVVIISFIGFLGDFIYGTIIFALPLYISTKYSDYSGLAAYLISINFLIFTVFAPINGKILDKFEIKKTMVLSLFAVSITFLLVGITNKLNVFLIVLIIEFIFGSLLMSCNQLNAIDVGNKSGSTGRLFGVLGTAQSIGSSISPILAGILMTLNHSFIFIVISIISLLIIATVLFLGKN